MPPDKIDRPQRCFQKSVSRLLRSGPRRLVRAVRRLLWGHGGRPGPTPALSGWSIRSAEEAQLILPHVLAYHFPHSAFEETLSSGDEVVGYSVPAGEMVTFAIQADIRGYVNFREGLICPVTRLSNRSRAVFHKFRYDFGDRTDLSIYVTEQSTHLYLFLKGLFPGLIGSEFLPHITFGTTDSKGIRSEDLTHLSFGDESQDTILSLDVLEHIPDYKAALSECARVLKPGGRIYITAPFAGSAKTLVRAKIDEGGKIIHLLEPDYHGDPISGDGILCYYYFGWDLLEDMKASGFTDAFAFYYWSKDYGYLGILQMMIIGQK